MKLSQVLTMKLLILLGLVTLVYARSIDSGNEPFSLFGYMTKYGIPLAEEIRLAEEAQSRIVGGSISSPGQFPYQAGLLVSFPGATGVCGGSLVNNRRVFTAAHCWNDGLNQGISMTVVLGSVTIFTGGTRLNTNTIAMHPQWSPSLTRNDIAVIYLPTTITFTTTINAVSLPSGSELGETFAGSAAVASGFGLIASNIPINNNQVLRHVTLNIITNAVCTSSYPGIVQDSNICTSGAGGGSTCRGDSGGPLVVNRSGRSILVGVTSFGHIAGCEAGFPAVFARTTFYYFFIYQHW